MDNRELKKVMLEADKNLEDLKDRCHELFKENEELKKKIKKVIEYIQMNYCNNFDLDDCWHLEIKYILEILQR